MFTKSVRIFLLGFVLILTIWINAGCGAVTAVPTLQTTIPTQLPIPTATHTSASAPLHALTLAPVPTSSTSNTSAISLKDECRTIVDGLYRLKEDLELPEYFMSDNPFRQPSDFDPNQYFQVLSHLSVAEGYQLDYIYYKDDLGGFPLVYARKSNTIPFHSYNDLLKSFGEDISRVGVVRYGYLPHKRDYRDKIQIDKSPESYFEYLTMWMLLDQFYLWQRGLYNDEKILCDLSDMKYVYEDMKNFDLEFPQSVKDRIEQIDFSPFVIMGEKTMIVRFITFTKWSGFWENAFVLEKGNPGHWLDDESTQLIDYDSGIEF